MQLYEILLNGETRYIKSTATSEEISKAIEFIKLGEVDLNKLLQAIRTLGFKATELKLEPVDIFEV